MFNFPTKLTFNNLTGKKWKASIYCMYTKISVITFEIAVTYSFVALQFTLNTTQKRKIKVCTVNIVFNTDSEKSLITRNLFSSI